MDDITNALSSGRDMIVVSGHNFFVGIKDDWQHQHEYIRINYAAQSPERSAQGLKLIAQKVGQALLGWQGKT